MQLGVIAFTLNRIAKVTHHEPADILMISDHAPWPLDQGFKVHGYNMATALSRLGYRVRFVTMQPLPDDAPDALRNMHAMWRKEQGTQHAPQEATGNGPFAFARKRVMRFLNDAPVALTDVAGFIDEFQPRVVIGLGIHIPLALHVAKSLRDVPCVWYAADELVNFHLSCLRRDPMREWPRRLRRMLVHGAMERLFANGLDGAIGVSPRDTRLLKAIAGVPRAVTVRNGVDLDYFHDRPPEETARPESLVFWGRLDFEPNVDAVTWFADHVWPRLLKQYPAASWRIVGKAPVARVQGLNALPGVEVVGPVDDLRHEAWSSAATILPMRCGGGIKNKLLEAAAMHCPIIASPRAVKGLSFHGDPCLRLANTPAQWVKAIGQLWSQPTSGRSLGTAARQWVEREHSWDHAAAKLARWLSDFTALTQTSQRMHAASLKPTEITEKAASTVSKRAA